jgi:hypothetical protein
MGRVKVSDVKNVGFSADLFPQPEGAKFSQELTDVVVGIGYITENPRVSRTGLDTIGQLPLFDAVVAKGAFFHDTLGSDSRQGVISFGIVIWNHSGIYLLGYFVWGARGPID